MSLSNVSLSKFSCLQYFSTLKICWLLEFCFRNVRPKITSNFWTRSLIKQKRNVFVLLHGNLVEFRISCESVRVCEAVTLTYPRSSVQQSGSSRSRWGLLRTCENISCDGPGKRWWAPATAAPWCRSPCPQTGGTPVVPGCCLTAGHMSLRGGHNG